MTFTRAFCTRGNWCSEQDDDVCENCHFFTVMEVPTMVVYRPHRRAVVQSCWNSPKMDGKHFFPRVVLQARLGCPAARVWVKRRRRLHNRVERGEFGWYLGHKGHKRDSDPGDLPELYLGTGLV